MITFFNFAFKTSYNMQMLLFKEVLGQILMINFESKGY